MFETIPGEASLEPITNLLIIDNFFFFKSADIKHGHRNILKTKSSYPMQFKWLAHIYPDFQLSTSETRNS